MLKEIGADGEQRRHGERRRAAHEGFQSRGRRGPAEEVIGTEVAPPEMMKMAMTAT